MAEQTRPIQRWFQLIVDRSCVQARRVSEALLKQASEPDARQGFAEKQACFCLNASNSGMATALCECLVYARLADSERKPESPRQYYLMQL